MAVADTTGELRALTQLADLVFIGKSLPPHTEGQTPVEAATLGKPILLGPGMANFRAIGRDLLERGAARRVATRLHDPHQGVVGAAAASAWRQENSGAAGRTLDVIRAQLAALSPS